MEHATVGGDMTWPNIEQKTFGKMAVMGDVSAIILASTTQ